MRLVSCIAFSLLCSSLPLSAQNLLANPDYVVLQNNTSSGVVHWYSGLSNLTTDTIHYRWYMQKDADWPVGWITYLTDPGQNYNPVDGIDSSDFIMDTIWDPLDKLILQVNHQGIPALSGVSFTLVNQDNIQDTVRIYFSVRINPVTNITATDQEAVPYWFVDAGHCLQARNISTDDHWVVMDLSGKLLHESAAITPLCLGNRSNRPLMIGFRDKNNRIKMVKHIFLH